MKIEKQNIESNLGLVLRRCVIDAAKELNDAEFRELINTLYDYAVNGGDVKLKSNASRIIFNMERSFLDYNRAKFISRSNKNNAFNELLTYDKEL